MIAALAGRAAVAAGVSVVGANLDARRTMATTLTSLAVPGKTVLPAPAATRPRRDYCEQLRRQWKAGPEPMTDKPVALPDE